MFLLDTDDRCQSPLRSENQCCVFLHYINLCPDLHPWSSVCEGAQPPYGLGGKHVSVMSHSAAVPAATAKLLLFRLLLPCILGFLCSFPRDFDYLIIFQSIFNASSQFLLQLSYTRHSSYGWGLLQCRVCLSICLPQSLQVLGWYFSISELSSLCTVTFHKKTCWCRDRDSFVY